MRRTHNSTNEETFMIELWESGKVIWAFVVRFKSWILINFFLFGFIGFVLTKVFPPRFLATTTFSLESGSSKSGSLLGLASQFGLSIGGDDGTFKGDNLLRLMKSRRLIDEVLLTPIQINQDTVVLVNQFVATDKSLKSKWTSLGIYPVKRLNCCNNRQDSAIGHIHKLIVDKKLNITKEEKDLSIVSLSLSSHDPYFAKNFVEILTQKATEFYILSKTSNNRANINKLQRRVDSVTFELAEAMALAARSNDASKYTIQSTAKVSAVENQMKVTILTTLYGELIKNLELSKTMAARDEPIITIIDKPHYPLRVHLSIVTGTLIGGAFGVLFTLIFFGIGEIVKNLKLGDQV